MNRCPACQQATTTDGATARVLGGFLTIDQVDVLQDALRDTVDGVLRIDVYHVCPTCLLRLMAGAV